MDMSKSIEFRLLPPKLLLLSPERELAAVRLLTELLLDEVARRRGDISGGDSDGALDDGFAVVVPFPEGREEARKAA